MQPLHDKISTSIIIYVKSWMLCSETTYGSKVLYALPLQLASRTFFKIYFFATSHIQPWCHQDTIKKLENKDENFSQPQVFSIYQ